MPIAVPGRVSMSVFTLVLLGLMAFAGCGGGSAEPTTNSTSDELSEFIADNPDLKNTDTSDGE